MKRFVAVSLAALFLVGCGDSPTETSSASEFEAAFDHQPNHVPATIEITAPADGDVIELDLIDPTANVLTVTVKVMRDGGSGSNANLCAVHDLEVGVNGTSIGGVPGNLFNHPQDTCEAEWDYNFDWNYDEEDLGFYNIGASVIASSPSTDDEAGDTITVELIGEAGNEVILANPAAPAVAASLLKAADISPRYGQGRNGGNHIADVADNMGPRTDFDGVEKTDVHDYCIAVADFLQTKSVPAAVDEGVCPE